MVDGQSWHPPSDSDVSSLKVRPGPIGGIRSSKEKERGRRKLSIQHPKPDLFRHSNCNLKPKPINNGISV